MVIVKSDRGFEFLEHPAYLPPHAACRLVSQSSAIDFGAKGGAERPGSSYLWVGDSHHLGREEVAELVARLQTWLKTGSLELPVGWSVRPAGRV